MSGGGIVNARLALTRPAESDLEPWPVPSDFARLGAPPSELGNAAAQPSTGLAARAADDRLVDERHAWWWLIVAAIVLLLLEARLAKRTVL